VQQLELGQAIVTPQEPVAAGSVQTIIFTYTAGHPVDDSGSIKIAFRFAGDFGTPQFDAPSAANYCTVSTTGNCQIQPRWDTKGHTRPWGHTIYLKVLGGFLNTGEQVIVVFGDTSAGSPGWQIQTFCEDTFEFKTLVDPIATFEFKELPSSPLLRIVPGEPVRAVYIAPSQVETGASFEAYFKLEDLWGNPTDKPQRTAHPGFPMPGLYRLTEQDPATGLMATSNPIRAVTGRQPFKPYWGDLHGQSEETIGTNSIDDYFTFARDYARVDMAAHQGNDFQVSDELWDKINDTTRRFYNPGAFVTFPGYEWSGNTPLGGDRNVYFSSEGGKVVHSCTDLLPEKQSVYETAPTAAELFAALAKQTDPQAFAFAHVGGRYADLNMHDAAIELAVEVHSAWGTFEWLVDEALNHGYRIGICANSDGHKGRPGASYPGARKFGSYGGLTCVLASELTREAVFEALQNRHFFATTGNRCLIDVVFEGEDGAQGMMGDVVACPSGIGVLHASIAGTAAIESVEVRNGARLITTQRPYASADLGNRIKVIWRGAEVQGRERQTTWDGRLVLTDNSIQDVTPINFWNAAEQPQCVDDRQVVWRSITTGGLAGLILKLEAPLDGTITVETLQRTVSCSVGEVQLEPQVWHCGGLGNQIEVVRLPDGQPRQEFSFELALDHLHPGDNPLYVRVTQEDGHMAWTSPIYVTRR